MPRLTDLHARRAAARERYAARHAGDEPLPDPELVACHVSLPAYLEPEAHLVPQPVGREEQERTDIEECIRNRSHCRPGEARLSERV